MNSFINEPRHKLTLEEFCSLDDFDVLAAIKSWSNHPDKVLSVLCKGIINRDLLKVKYFAKPIDKQLIKEKRAIACSKLKISEADAADQLRMLAELGESDAATEEARGYGLGESEETENVAGP